MALEPQASPDRVQPPVDPASVQESRAVEETCPVAEERTALEPAAEKKVFQAFNIKPLRQKLPATVNLDELRRMSADQENGGEAEMQGEQNLCVIFMLLCTAKLCISGVLFAHLKFYISHFLKKGTTQVTQNTEDQMNVYKKCRKIETAGFVVFTSCLSF